ncbi:MAG: hypothetical protein WDM89_15395 [Rhizomicrobium sp.]
MPLAVILGAGTVALLSGPIFGGVRWHAWNRNHGDDAFTYRRRSEYEHGQVPLSESDEEDVTA